MTDSRHRPDYWLLACALWALAGVAFFCISLAIVLTRPEPRDPLVELRGLIATGQYGEFYQRAREYLPQLDDAGTAMVLKAAWQHRAKVSGTDAEAPRRVALSLDGRLLQNQTLLRLAGHICLAEGDAAGVLSLYKKAGAADDQLVAAALASQKRESEAMALLLRLAAPADWTPEAGWRALATYLNEPAWLAWALALRASQGDMVSALDGWPARESRKEYKSRIQAGYLALMAANFRLPGERYLALLDPDDPDPHLLQALAEAEFRSRRYADGLRLWRRILERVEDREDAGGWYESLRHILALLPDTDLRSGPDSRFLASRLKQYDTRFPRMALAGLAHDAVVSALWHRFQENPRDLAAWKLLAWYAVANRDQESLRPILDKQEFRAGGWHEFFQACALVASNEALRAQPLFVEAGHHGIGEGFACAAAIAQARGDSKGADRYRALQGALEQAAFPFGPEHPGPIAPRNKE